MVLYFWSKPKYFDYGALNSAARITAPKIRGESARENLG